VDDPTLFDDEQPPSLEDVVRELIRQHGFELVVKTVRYLTPITPQPAAPARWTDPDTSHGAARQHPDVSRFGDASRKAKMLRSFAVGPMTQQEAAVRVVGGMAAPSAFDGCRRRASDLAAAGYIVDTGGRRANRGSRSDSIIWQVTEAGWHALERLDDTGWSR